MQDNLQISSYKQLEQKSKYTNIFLRWFLYFVLILFASYFIFPLYVMVVTSLKTPFAVFKLISLSLENPPARIKIFFFIYSTKIISKSKLIPVLFFTASLTKSINFFISL